MGGVGEGVLGTARLRVCAPWRPFLCIAARAHRLARSHSIPWVPVAVAGAGAVALARPEVRAGRALASLGRGVVIGAFPA